MNDADIKFWEVLLTTAFAWILGVAVVGSLVWWS